MEWLKCEWNGSVEKRMGMETVTNEEGKDKLQVDEKGWRGHGEIGRFMKKNLKFTRKPRR